MLPPPPPRPPPLVVIGISAHALPSSQASLRPEERRDRAMMGAGEQHYGPRGAPHGVLLAVVVGLVVAGPLFLGGDGGEAVTEAVAELLSPVGLLLLPVGLVVLIRVLSSDRGGAAFADALAFGGSPEDVHRVGGSPVGVALALLLILLMLYCRSSLFGGDDE